MRNESELRSGPETFRKRVLKNPSLKSNVFCFGGRVAKLPSSDRTARSICGLGNLVFVACRCEHRSR